MKSRIEKLITKKMNVKLTLFAIVLLTMPFTVKAQKSIFDRYGDNPEVTFVNIKPKMFQMIAKMGVDTSDPETKSFMDMVKSITSFKTLATDNKLISTDISKWVKGRSKSLEELMEVKDNGSEVKFYVQEGKDEDHVKELLIFVNGIDKHISEKLEINGEKRSIETVVVSFTGDINLNEISKLTEKMNIPAGEHLEKK